MLTLFCCHLCERHFFFSKMENPSTCRKCANPKPKRVRKQVTNSTPLANGYSTRDDGILTYQTKKPLKRTFPRGQYVYGWFLPGSDLPFYVGRGQGNRAWEKHRIEEYPGIVGPAFCERIRTENTRIEIFRDNLTEEGSILIEAVLIKVFASLGAFLVNQASPTQRQECPPLECI